MKPEMEEHYPLRKAAEILGVHPVTLRRWEKEGKIRCIRTPSGQRRFTRSEVLRLVGETMPSGRRAVIYARISSAKQAGSGNLERQRQRLEEYCRSRGYEIVATQDMLSILTVFSAKLYGSRGKEFRKKVKEAMADAAKGE
jgi:putative resolvase